MEGLLEEAYLDSGSEESVLRSVHDDDIELHGLQLSSPRQYCIDPRSFSCWLSFLCLLPD